MSTIPQHVRQLAEDVYDAVAATQIEREFERYRADPSWRRSLAWHGTQAMACRAPGAAPG